MICEATDFAPWSINAGPTSERGASPHRVSYRRCTSVDKAWVAGGPLKDSTHRAEGCCMGVVLRKGGNVSLSKEASDLTAVAVGLGWDVRKSTGADFDLDASAIICGANGKVLSDLHF